MDSKLRFSDRAENYAKYRPRYPEAVFEFLKQECGIDSSSEVADVGAGTGIFAGQIAPFVARAFAIEPNREMRQEAAKHLADVPNVAILDGSAEQVPLEDSSVNLVTAAQAFHWFDQESARTEFARILRPPGWVALIWNVRDPGKDAFQEQFDQWLQTWAPNYKGANHGESELSRIEGFFGPKSFKKAVFRNAHFLFWEELLGRTLSSSYFPLPTSGQHDQSVQALKEIFDDQKVGGRVNFDYRTEVYLGMLDH